MACAMSRKEPKVSPEEQEVGTIRQKLVWEGRKQLKEEGWGLISSPGDLTKAAWSGGKIIFGLEEYQEEVHFNKISPDLPLAEGGDLADFFNSLQEDRIPIDFLKKMLSNSKDPAHVSFVIYTAFTEILQKEGWIFPDTDRRTIYSYLKKEVRKSKTIRMCTLDLKEYFIDLTYPDKEYLVEPSEDRVSLCLNEIWRKSIRKDEKLIPIEGARGIHIPDNVRQAKDLYSQATVMILDYIENKDVVEYDKLNTYSASVRDRLEMSKVLTILKKNGFKEVQYSYPRVFKKVSDKEEPRVYTPAELETLRLRKKKIQWLLKERPLLTKNLAASLHRQLQWKIPFEEFYLLMLETPPIKFKPIGWDILLSENSWTIEELEEVIEEEEWDTVPESLIKLMTNLPENPYHRTEKGIARK
jgi:hypothetical protein